MTENNNKGKGKGNNSQSAWGGLIFIILFVLIMVIVIWVLVENQKNAARPYLDRGCTPVEHNFLGSVTIWDCPVE
jgi:hypothetical protein